MLRRLKRLVRKALIQYPKRICRLEFEQQTVKRFNERPVEFQFVFRTLAKIYPGKILDVGTGLTALPHLMRNCGFHVTAIDNVKDYWPSGVWNRHYHVIDDDITKPRLSSRFDLITCISVLEHIKEKEGAIRNMFNLLNPNGFLILTFPYNEETYIKNVYDLPGSSYGKDLPYICQAYSRKELDQWIKKNDAEIIEQEYWRFWDGDYWTVGKQIIPPCQVDVQDKHQLSCVLLQKRG